MKTTIVRFTIAALALAVLDLVFVPAARADRQSKADATAILTAGKWHFKGKHFSFDVMFDTTGTMTIIGFSGKDSTAKWKADYKEIVLTFSYYQEVLSFPIDPKGTSGIDAWGDEFTATMVGAPSIALPTPTPTGLSALQPIATPTPVVDARAQTAAIVAQLTAKKWLFTGSNWSEKRMFNANGTMTVDNNKPANWQIVGNQIVMTFSDRKETLNLPLDPNGTKGKDAFGFDITAVQVGDTGSSSGGGSSAFGTTGK